MENDTGIDFSKFRNYIKNIFSNNDSKEKVIIDVEDFYRIIKQEKILVKNKSIDSFFCPAFLIDKENNKRYPILFFKTNKYEIQNNIYIEKEIDTLPIYSFVFDEFLKNNNISLEKESRLLDIPSFLFSLKSSIESKGLSNNLIIEYSLSFYSSTEILYHSIYNSLPQLSNIDLVSTKYHGFIKKLYDEEIEDKIKKEQEDKFLSPLNIAIDSLDGYKSCKVIYNNDSDKEYFLSYFIRNDLVKNKSILFITKNKNELDDLNNFLKNNNFDSYVYKYSSFKPLNFKREDCLKRGKKDYSKAIEDKRRLNQERSDYLNLKIKKQSLYIHPTLEDDLQKLLYQSQFEGIDPFVLDLDDYSETDFENDVKFLKNINQYKSVLSMSIKENPLYGLSLSDKKENYDNLVLTISQACSKLLEFTEFLKNNNVVSFDGKEITNFRQFLELGKDMDVLSEYNGFPKRYFKNGEDEEDPNFRLEDLKNLYKAVSSSRLMVENLFDSKIYQQDIDKLVSDFENGSIFKKIEVKKILKGYLKTDTTTTDYNLFIRILKHYRNAITILNVNLPYYQELYGDSVSNMNGVIEIESNIKYLRKFKMRGKYNPAFKFDTPRIKKAIREKEFRFDIIDTYKEARKIYDEYILLMNKYIGYFIDDKKDYLGIEFSKIYEEFLRKQNITYSMFSEYASFKSDLEKTSIQLQLKIREFTVQNKKISLFKNQYLLSLYYGIYLTAEKSFKEDKELKEISRRYFKDIDKIPTIRKEMFNRDIDDSINNLLDNQTELINNTVKNINGTSISNEDIKNTYYLYNITHPICIANIDEISNSYSDQFDIVVIYDSKNIDTLSLFGMIDCGKEVLFLNPQSNNDVRLQGYNENSINSDRMYLNHFKFNNIPYDFIEYVKGKAPEYGFDLIIDDPQFKWILQDKNNPNNRYILVPDVCVSSLYKESLSQLREYLQAYKKLKMIDFILFEALFEKETFIEERIELFEEKENTSD